MTTFSIGSIVKCRGREWVVQPSELADVLMLRPMGGAADETVGIYIPLEGQDITPATFDPPTAEKTGDLDSCKLLLDSVRFSLRSGAGPFRSMGQLSVRPRPYQLVPLLMSLRLDTVRLLIADDVGVGKTIEGALVARELLDRGEAHRLCVLCPPHLCDQWKSELTEKFNLPAVVVRPATIPTLERQKPLGDVSIFRHYPIQVVSIDYAKAHSRRAIFLNDVADLMIVDEAHAASRPAGANVSQQQRHELLVELAKKPGRHMIFLTATPHSGVEESFVSLLGLLKPKFAELDTDTLSEESRAELARHFVQRRRADVTKWLGDTHFPKRIPVEQSYELSSEYAGLFRDIYDFAREMVASSETLSGWKQRVRYWAALALLRCVMSSPAAAEAALLAKAARMEVGEEEPDVEGLGRYVHDRDADEMATDLSPSQVMEEAEEDLGDSGRARLRRFAKRAAELKGSDDRKLATAIDILRELLAEGFQPIVFCRYIQTANYVADGLERKLKNEFPNLACTAVTGELAEEAREQKVRELGESERRVLVATDCLSEGVNLQDWFTAVVHYDLPWNPNRLEQREGRVDRFGQRAEEVKAVLLYGKDNAIDGAVLNVLLRKAVEIHKRLGIRVPLPVNSETVVESVLKSLFLRGPEAVTGQLALEMDLPVQTVDVHEMWEKTAERERESRTRFAQHAIKPDQVAVEIEESDAALGSQEELQEFIKQAVGRLGSSLRPDKKGWRLDTLPLEHGLRRRLPFNGDLKLSFDTPPPEGYMYVGRLHPLTQAITDYLMETALDGASDVAARSGAIRTSAVSKRTTLLLLRARYVMASKDREQLAEKAVITGWVGSEVQRLSEEEAQDLLRSAQPSGSLDDGYRKQLVAEALAALPDAQGVLEAVVQEGADSLAESYKRVSAITKKGTFSVEPQLPVDVLGVYVLLPVPGGVKS